VAKGGVESFIRNELLQLMTSNTHTDTDRPYVLTDAAWYLWTVLNADIRKSVLISSGVSVANGLNVAHIFYTLRYNNLGGQDVEIAAVAFMVICLAYAREDDQLSALAVERQTATQMWVKEQAGVRDPADA